LRWKKRDSRASESSGGTFEDGRGIWGEGKDGRDVRARKKKNVVFVFPEKSAAGRGPCAPGRLKGDQPGGGENQAFTRGRPGEFLEKKKTKPILNKRRGKNPLPKIALMTH